MVLLLLAHKPPQVHIDEYIYYLSCGCNEIESNSPLVTNLHVPNLNTHLPITNNKGDVVKFRFSPACWNGSTYTLAFDVWMFLSRWVGSLHKGLFMIGNDFSRIPKNILLLWSVNTLISLRDIITLIVFFFNVTNKVILIFIIWRMVKTRLSSFSWM